MHGWGGVATALWSAFDLLESAVADLDIAEESMDTALSKLSQVTDRVGSVGIGECLAGGAEELGQASTSLNAVTGSAENAWQAAQYAGEPLRLVEMLQNLLSNVDRCHTGIDDAKAKVVAEGQKVSAWAKDSPPGSHMVPVGPAHPVPLAPAGTHETILNVPQGLTPRQFLHVAIILRGGTSHIGDDVIVHGSRATGTARKDSDIDFAVRVSGAKFDAFVSERFGTPNVGSAKERTMQRAVETGKIQAGEAGLSRLRRSLEIELDLDVDLSVITRSGPFDNPPSIEVPRP